MTRSRALMIAEIALLLGLNVHEAISRFILHGPRPGEVFYFSSGVVIGALALLRRRYPERTGQLAAVAVAISLLCSGVGGLAEPAARLAGDCETLALMLLIGACCHRLPPIEAGALAVVGGFAMVIAPVSRYSGDQAALTIAVFWAILWGVGVAVGLILRDGAARREEALAAARNRERLALARELHDLVAHHITGVVVSAQAAQVVLADGTEQKLLGDIEQAGSEALAAVRRMVGVLRSPDDAPAVIAGGLVESVQSVVDGNVILRMAPGLAELAVAPETVSTVHRVLLESLTNVRKHAPDARQVTVAVTAEDRLLRVEIRNDGLTRTRRTAGGYGLIGMGERIDALGGTLTAGPYGERSWQVLAQLPLSKETS
ncbi:two-component sensor histidine kinase [Kribbella antibiotica]|uniref:histidine kinase n=1 Tax=Kribbella antibiotica TaxID=190195 RepID=A0A4R4ZX90_9ACTN|nr:histidine kinase [Kribbella antibiotica]TDD63210.1 two-component sensor histidine kinase [Kribbella antibiotica]